MKIAIASTAALFCCLSLACSDGTEDTGNLGGGATAGVGGASAGAATVAGMSSGGSSSGAPSAAGSSTTAGSTFGGGSSGGSSGANGGGSGGTGGDAIPTDGPGLYGLYCSMCHGEQGRGSKDGPDIMHPIREYSTWVVRNGRAQTTYPKPMLPRTQQDLSDAQLTLIFDYLDTPPQPTTGAALYADYCQNCHGADGKSGPVMKNIAMELGELKEQVRKGAHPGEYEMRKEFMPVFTTMRLSDSDLDLVYMYVDSL